MDSVTDQLIGLFAVHFYSAFRFFAADQLVGLLGARFFANQLVGLPVLHRPLRWGLAS